jgi:hypothetical protein
MTATATAGATAAWRTQRPIAEMREGGVVGVVVGAGVVVGVMVRVEGVVVVAVVVVRATGQNRESQFLEGSSRLGL